MPRFCREAYLRLRVDNVAKDPDTVILQKREDAELAEAADTVAEGEETLNEATESMIGLLSIRDHLIQAKERYGGTSHVHLQAVQSYIKRVGFPKKQNLLPSKEAMNSFGSRARYTDKAIEGITELINDVWKWIKEYYDKFMNWIKEFFMKYFSRVGRAHSEIEHLKKLTDKVKNSSYSGEDTFDNLKAISRLKTRGDFKPIESIPEFTSIFVTLMASMADFGKDNITALISRLQAFKDNPEAIPDELVVNFRKPHELFIETGVRGYDPGAPNDAHGRPLVTTHVLENVFPGDMIVLGYFMTKAANEYTYEDIEKAAGLVKIFLGVDQAKTYEAVEKVEYISAQGVFDLLSIAERLSEEAKKADVIYSGLLKSKETLGKLVDEINSSLKKAHGADTNGVINHRFARSSMTRLRAIDNVCITPCTQLSVAALDIVLATIDFCKENISKLNESTT